jgi:hypothetical protein
VGFLSKQYGGAADPRHMALGLDEPAGTITTWDHHALIGTPFLVKTIRSENAIEARDSLAPIYTQTTCQDVGLVSPAFIAEMHGKSKAGGIDEPLMCITSSGAHHALLSADAF